MAKKSVKTIEDIARLANVSKSTVSRALNDSSLVKQETRERIQAIAREYNFRLNAPARNLSMRQSHTVAFVTHAYHQSFSVDDLFGLEIMGSIAARLSNLGYDFLVVHVNPKDTDWANQYLDSGKVDGFILMTSSRKQMHIKTLAEMNAPFIIWGMPHPKYSHCSVTGDNITGGRLATEYLIRSGRQRIAFLGGPVEEMEVQQRFQGYELALATVGRTVNPDLLAYGNYLHASGITAVQRLLQQAPDLDAVFVNSDLMAIGAISAIQNSGRRIPDDVAVVGYDDLSIAAFNSLPLTTVRQNIPLAGKLLAQNLVQFIRTGVVTNVTVPVELVIRESA
ncbi:MAG: LacI family DNA-binding transcriptional regulator [Ardenticatenaceae bacterium]|nr:LacI family DNA-binding transcriptional regulator [Ardenticatenaceae bacterium]